MYLKNSEYKITQKLGAGSDHYVFKGQHNLTQNGYAVKIEKKPGIGQIENEILILQDLSGIDGIPRLIQIGKTNDQKNFLIIPLLNCSLQDLARSNKLSLRIIIALGLSVIRIIKEVHKRGILHLDIKPENIMITSNQLLDSVEQILIPGNVQLIDFGLSQKIGNTKFLKETFIGSLRFASRQSHKREQLGYKDDLESLLYVLAYLINKKLPWQQQQQKGFQLLDIKKIGAIKDYSFKTSLLSQKFPSQLYQFQQYIDTLTSSTLPDYNHIEDLFKQMLKINTIQIQTSCPEPIQQTDILEEFENSEDIIANESIPKRDSDAGVILVSDLIKPYTTMNIKSIKDIHF